MRCPYRIVKEVKHLYNSDVTTEHFAECYGRECPLYTRIPCTNNYKCRKVEEEGGKK